MTALLGALLVGAAAGAWAQQLDENPYEIQLKSRRFTPKEGFELEAAKAASASSDSVHILMQFDEIPGEQDKAALAARGIRLLQYLNGNTFIASVAPKAMDEMSSSGKVSGVRWAGSLTVNDKSSAELKSGQVGKWAITDDQRVVLTVQFHGDVGIEDAEAVVQSYGGEIVASLDLIPAVTAIFHLDQVRYLAGEDSVQYVDAAPPPLQPTNDSARNAARVTPLQSRPYNLTGNGVTVLVYDSGRMDGGHPDLAGRVLQTDGSTVKDHATHVAGTVGGSGINSNGFDGLGRPNGGLPFQWAGMAPSVSFRSFGSSGSTDVLYDSGGDLLGDFATALASGVDLANMSLANNVVLNGFPCRQLGDYTNTSILLDIIVRGRLAGQNLIYFVAAGNERQLGAPCGQFATIGSPATAKNTIAVGAINSNNNTIASFSSFGPTDDGRLKPDITAPGCQTTGDRGIKSTSRAVRNGYVVKCGTSMASPVATGATSLLIEQWRRSRGSQPLMPRTAKAILVHTAIDRGNVGPDYQFGWGTLNAKAAVDLVRVAPFLARIREDAIHDRELGIYRFHSNGRSIVKVTLAWDDPAASRLVRTTLINDLDLLLVDPAGRRYRPFVLNPARPTSAARRGVDRSNNVEMAIGLPRRGYWTAYVTGRRVPLGPQEFTLIVPNQLLLDLPRPIPIPIPGPGPGPIPLGSKLGKASMTPDLINDAGADSSSGLVWPLPRIASRTGSER